MLTSTFVACFALFSDLNSPFSGSYSIATSADQLRTIRTTLNASARQEEREAEKSVKEHVTVETQQTLTQQVKNITMSGTGTNGSDE
jgi:hypothetical protein